MFRLICSFQMNDIISSQSVIFDRAVVHSLGELGEEWSQSLGSGAGV